MFVTAAIEERVRLHLQDVYSRLWRLWPETDPLIKVLQLTTQQPDQIASVDDVACRITPLG